MNRFILLGLCLSAPAWAQGWKQYAVEVNEFEN